MTLYENDLYFAKLRPDAIIPTKREEDAGYDIYPCFEEELLVIKPGETKLIPTGIASAFHKSKYIQIEERSSTGSKGIKKSAGVIDSGYRGEWKIAITNASNVSLIIGKPSEEELLENSILDENGDKIIKTDNGKVSLYWYSGGQYVKMYVYYPYSKAIAQAIVHEVPAMNTQEIAYEQLQEFTSERASGGFGSTNK